MSIPNDAALTCREVVERVRDYLAEDMSADATVRLEQHLHACTCCMTYLEQLRATVSALGQLDAPPAESTVTVRERMQALFRGMNEP